MKIEELNKKHDRKSFDCGVKCLNTYLHNTARQHGDGGGSKTFVLVEDDKPKEIIGYFTMTVCIVDLENFPLEMAKSYSKGPPPYAVLLARLAVDKKYKGNDYGSVMMMEAIKRTELVTDHVGGWGLFVDAKDETAVNFYKKHGFQVISTDPNILFLPIHVIKQI